MGVNNVPLLGKDTVFQRYTHTQDCAAVIVQKDFIYHYALNYYTVFPHKTHH